jgi:bacteriorhodopsin
MISDFWLLISGFCCFLFFLSFLFFSFFVGTGACPRSFFSVKILSRFFSKISHETMNENL